ncbi:MAG: amidohydrolase [Synergistaceae bacterium]|jgi:amidohydrolase|nr:amidohydrolase [Synergistaceae bacterium]
MIEKIKALAKEYEGEIIERRRHFHKNPETSWNEVETSGFIAEELKKLGCENIVLGYGGTRCGVTADIAGSGSKCVALRADIDALPLDDEKDVPYKSQRAGAMHACGHDSHAAMLLGAAKILTKIKGELKGRVRLLFQPAEEHGIKPGAPTLVEEGALKGVNAVFGIHSMSNVPSGELRYRSGPFMAAADAWELVLTGKGGHASTPEYSIDPTIAVFQIGSALQTIVSREVSPKDTAVVSIGGMRTSSHVFNIIPERVEINGSVRTFRPEVQDRVEEAMRRIIGGICEAARCKSDFKYNRVIPSTFNDPDCTELARSTGELVFGADNIKESDLIMGSEDFSFYSRVAPSVFVNLGVGNAEKKSDMPHHSSKFDVDESALFLGAAMHASFAWRYLGQN